MERQPIVAGRFYPASADECKKALENFMQNARPQDPTSYGGIVPHAGWIYSGATAACVYAALQTATQPETVVIVGAVHHWGVDHASVYPDGTWRTPLGAIEIDAELAAILVQDSESQVVSSAKAHANEHAIEVQVPFVQYCLPNAQLLPISVPPNEQAPVIGAAIARAAKKLGRRIVIIASTDLTHYGAPYGFAPAGYGNQALDWTHQNDQHFIDLVCSMDANSIMSEASLHRNACGAGAVAAAIGCAQNLGSTGAKLLHYTTSHEVDPIGEPAVMVGYAAIAFI